VGWWGGAPPAAPVFRARCVSGSERLCRWQGEVNWKKLRRSHRGAEARGNKLDISPIHVGWCVYTIPPPPHQPPILSPAPPPPPSATHTFLGCGHRLRVLLLRLLLKKRMTKYLLHYHASVQIHIYMSGYPGMHRTDGNNTKGHFSVTPQHPRVLRNKLCVCVCTFQLFWGGGGKAHVAAALCSLPSAERGKMFLRGCLTERFFLSFLFQPPHM